MLRKLHYFLTRSPEREALRFGGGGQRRTVTCAARHRKFIIKPTDKSCGCGVKIIDTAVQSPETVFQNLIKSGKHVCEELVPRIPSSSS